ncbi:WecB/TagA/CpsF family glycosyltransferase [Bacteroidota bacterium]
MIFEKLYNLESDVLTLVEKRHKEKEGLLLTYFNQHCYNIYNSNQEYKHLMENEFEIFLDGTGIYYALKLHGFKNIQRFNATDFNEKIFNYFSEHGVRLFLIGGKFDDKFINEKASQKEINVLGYQNGFFLQSDFPLISEKIRRASPEAIIIGMGVPKQELIAFQIKQVFKQELIICVGNFFEYYFGTKRRAPEIFRKTRMEWFYRFLSEPRRLWKRYLIGIPFFIYNILKQYFRIKK